jgi:acetyl-CoA C-acetyltransferase
MGKAHKSLKPYKTVDLAAAVLKGVQAKSSGDASQIQQVIMGNALSAGVGQNLAREAVCLAGFPLELPAYVVNNVCGAGLQGLLIGYESVLSQRNQSMIIAAAESATHSPFLVDRTKRDHPDDDDFVDSLTHDGLLCQITHQLMGDLAENLARAHAISRADQDECAFQSHKKARQATEAGFFRHEMVGPASGQKGLKDDGIRRNINRDKLALLTGAFSQDGTVTAGNASKICDGAAAVWMADSQAIKDQGLQPKAKIVAAEGVAVDPADAYTSGEFAIQKCLKTAGLEIKDIDWFEICEAFAAQVLYTQRAMKIPLDKVNPWGGDIALGHPMGVSGLRALVTLMNALTVTEKRRGVVCVSFGGGGGIALIIERV